MDRYEFMWKLKSLLSDIPMQEREEAIQYYNDYFEDAGRENEADVIASLGSPEKVAENIKKDTLQNRFFEDYEGAKVEKGNEIVEYPYGWREEQEQKQSKPEKKRSGGMTALIVILCICASPILLSLAGIAFGILIVLFTPIIVIVIGCIGMVLGFGATALSLLVGAAFCIIVGIMFMPFQFLVGLVILAVGLIVGAIGLLFLAITVAMCGFVIPKLFQGIGWLFRSCFKRKKKSK